MAAKVLGVDVSRVGGRVGDSLGDLGGYLKEQRQGAQLSLRQLASMAGISNPYLSQVERGLRQPSAEVLQQIARGLRISAEALYVRAGLLAERGEEGDVRAAVLADPYLSERQRDVLLEIYATFRDENRRREVPTTPPSAAAAEPGPTGSDGSTGSDEPAPLRPRRRRSPGRRGQDAPQDAPQDAGPAGPEDAAPRPGGAEDAEGRASTGSQGPTATATKRTAAKKTATRRTATTKRTATKKTATGRTRAAKDAGPGTGAPGTTGRGTSRGTGGGTGTSSPRGRSTRTGPTPAEVAQEASVVSAPAPGPEELARSHDPAAGGPGERPAPTDDPTAPGTAPSQED